MKKLADFKKIIGHPAHQLAYLLIVKKTKRELLIMRKNLIAHIVFHFSSHNMAVISNKVVTIAF